jgi:hypothetical protein
MVSKQGVMEGKLKKTVFLLILLVLPAAAFASRPFNFSLNLGVTNVYYGVQKIAAQHMAEYGAARCEFETMALPVIELSFDISLFGSAMWFLRASAHAFQYDIFETQFDNSNTCIMQLNDINSLSYIGLGPEIVFNIGESTEIRLCGEIGYNSEQQDPYEPEITYRGFGGIGLKFDAGISYYFGNVFNLGLKAGITSGGYLFMLSLGWSVPGDAETPPDRALNKDPKGTKAPDTTP